MCHHTDEFYKKVICVLKNAQVPYVDCNGVVQGDCGICAGSGADGITSNSIAFNPATNEIVSVVNGVAATAVLSMTTEDVTTATTITIDGTDYPAGTSLTDILLAIINAGGGGGGGGHAPVTVADTGSVDLTLVGQHLTAVIAGIGSATAGQIPYTDGAGNIHWTSLSLHPPVNLGSGNNPALALNAPIQQLTLDLGAAGSYDNTLSGLVSDNIQGAIDEVAGLAGVPAGVAGNFLIHNGVAWQAMQRIEEVKPSVSGNTFTLGSLPASFAPFELYKMGQRLIYTDDYTRVGNTVTLVATATSDKFVAIYYI